MKSRPWLVVLSYVVIIVSTTVFLFPIFWLIIGSFKPPSEIFSFSVFFRPSLASYQEVLSSFPVLRYLRNSILIALTSTLVSVSTGALAAYSLSRYRFFARRHMLILTLMMRMLPGVALGIPLFFLFSRVQLTNTFQGLMLAHTAIQLPLVIWIMLGFFEDIPTELAEAGLVDGCNRFSVIYRIILPLATPGLAVSAIFAFLISWNNFDLSLILAPTPKLITMPVGMSQMNLLYGIRWDLLASAGVMYIIPTVILALALQRYIVRGLTLGAVKG